MTRLDPDRDARTDPAPHGWVRALNIGASKPRSWAKLGRSAIEKRPVEDAVLLTRTGLEGDEVGDTERHGGPDQAVYAFARADLDAWAATLRRPIPDGLFGENLTIDGYDVNEALIGEHWQIGDALLEVSSVRIPCQEFRNWMDLNGYDATGWVKRFTEVGRPGPYLRVLGEGRIRAGDHLRVTARPAHQVTASVLFRALTTDHALLPLLDSVDRLPERVRSRVAKLQAAVG